MKKFLNFISNNILFLFTLFLLAFIPLYPKLPLFDIQNTWVYIRLEDFVVASVLTIFIFLILFKKVKLKTPLTIPIFIFWLIGLISTLHGVLILFPQLPNVFSNVAFLSFLRRVEYLSLFFIAFVSIREKKYIYHVIAVLTIVLFLVVLYGIGQRFLGFPAFLTGNEEFAKGIPLRISALGRITSTFAGHYDLAAYLVLLIPIFVSLVFGVKNWLLKILFFLTASAGFVLIFMTVSRVSFFALLVSLLALLVLLRKRFLFVSLLLAASVFLVLTPALSQRFANTVLEVNVLTDAKTGAAISQVKEVPREYFKDKIILRHDASVDEAKIITSSAIYPYLLIPPQVQVLIAPNAPTGENLPQGTGYINLPLSPIIKRTHIYLTEKTIEQAGGDSSEIRAFTGNFLIKKAKAYDLSFTTRFQGEWPNAAEAFKRNIFIGSGYGSVSLAVDNDYLRLLGESGLFGLFSFISLFLIAGIYIKKLYPKIDSSLVRSFILGFVIGTFGLLLNGILIDVFEASKIAFPYWLLMGVTLGTVHVYVGDQNMNLYQDLKKAVTSSYAIIIYLLIATAGLLFPMFANYFVGDDFTWLRWAADSKDSLLSYFTDSDGFFYRPAAKIYFFLMYKTFWLNQTVYHFVSIILHSLVVLLSFIILGKILKNYKLSIISITLFLILTSYHETVFWISATGILFSTFFALLALLSFIYWKEKNEPIYIAFSLISIILSPLFHELGVVTPLIIIAYDVVFGQGSLRDSLFKKINLIVLLPLVPYMFLRFFSGSHWFSGDYSYNILKLPFNIIGNSIGYFVLDLFGPQSLQFYEALRNVLKANFVFAAIGFAIAIFSFVRAYKFILKRLTENEQKIIIFGFLFFIISLLPFLGLGNIASRYSYLSSIGFVILFAFFVKKSFDYLRSLGDKLTTSIIVILISLFFVSLQLFQLQKMHSDWKVAGEISKRFLVSFQEDYKDYWTENRMHFYFVDVPIKNGEAWVFPVGLKDALWFSLKNKDFNVDTLSNASLALDKAAQFLPSSEVYKVNKDGTINQIVRTKEGIKTILK